MPSKIHTTPWVAFTPRCCAMVKIKPKVVRMAMPMPVMPNTLPRRADVGWLRPLRAWIRQTEATKYNKTTRSMLIWQPLQQQICALFS